ncbi:MAG TPA: carboxypeptidase-like regulatory domain-containing protein [Thermoanaerobaculia bacterium]|nr:carboxypeptidase-like regulatory domain-containing protein [Thermoanaerobaculia bacterium]
MIITILTTASALASIHGLVMSGDGKPIGSAGVVAYAVETSDQRAARLVSASPERPVVASVKTNAKGEFEIDPKKLPVVELNITAPSFGNWKSTAVEGDDAGVFMLRPALTRTAHVRAEGKPVAGAIVSLMSGYETKTDENGAFTVPEFSGPTRIVVIAEGFTPVPVTVVDGKHGNMDVVLSRGVAIEGTAVLENGKSPFPKATVDVDGFPLGSTDDAGHFAIAHVDPSWREIRVHTQERVGTLTHPHGAAALRVITRPASRIEGTLRDAATKTPIANVMVSLIVGTGRGGFMGGDPSVRLSAFTDEHGGFALGPLAAGNYRLSASHPHWVIRGQAVSVPASTHFRSDLYATSAGTVSGTVVDERGTPIAAAGINFSQIQAGPVMQLPDASAWSGPNGHYVVRPLEPGTDFALSARRPGLPPGRSSAFRLSAGEKKNNFIVTIPSGIVIKGRVADSEKHPLAGVMVMPVEHNDQMSDWMVQSALSSANASDHAQSVADGTFSFRVAPGSYDIALRRDGYVVRILKKIDLKDGAQPLDVTLETAVEISGHALRPDGTPLQGANMNASTGQNFNQDPVITGADGSFTLTGLSSATYTVSVNKMDEGLSTSKSVHAPAKDVVLQAEEGTRISAIVVDDKQQPVLEFRAGMSVTKVNANQIYRQPAMMREFHTTDGQVVLEHNRPGTFELVVDAAGFAVKRVPIHVEEGKNVEGVEVALTRGVALSVRVVDPSGSPVMGAMVREVPAAGGPAVQDFFNSLRNATDANGECLFQDVDPAEKTFAISKLGYSAEKRSVKLSDAVTHIDVTLKSAKTLTGIVRTSAGSPVADAMIYARTPVQDSGSNVTRSDANGSFRIESLGSGLYEVRAQKQGFAPAIVKDVDVDTVPQPILLTLQAGGVVTGSVRGLDASQYKDVTIRAYGSAAFSTSPLQPDGSFRVDGLSGVVTMRAELREGTGSTRQSDDQSITVTEGAEQHVELAFSTGATIRGRVIWGAKPSPNTYVSFAPVDPASTTRASGQTDNDGKYEVTGLASGKYRVILMSYSRNYETTYTVDGSGTFDIEVRGSRITGHIVDSTSHEPIEGVIASLERIDDQKKATATGSGSMSDSSGTISFDSLEDGSYRLHVEKRSYAAQTVDFTAPSSTPVEISMATSDGVIVRPIDARDGRTVTAMFYATDAAGAVILRASQMEPATDGTYRLPLAPGTYKLTVGSWDYATRTLTVTSPSPELRIPLESGGVVRIVSKQTKRLRARLVSASGEPYRTQLWSDNTDLFITGTLELTHVLPGAYTLQILGDNGQPVDSKSVTVGDRTTVNVEI